MPELLDVSRTVFRVPISHRHCTFENFEWPSPAIKEAILTHLSILENDGRQNLLVTGTPGLGKTHLAISLYRWAVLRWGTGRSVFLQVPQFFSEVKKTFDSGQDRYDPFLEVEDARLLVLDDILGRVATPWEVDHVIYRLINTAHSNSASIVFTTNLTLDQVALVLKPHEMSRLLDNAIHLEFRGSDRRL